MIGVGRHATKVLLPALHSVPELDLVAVATSRKETARLAETRLKRKAYVGYEAMLQEKDIEAVLIVGGNHEEEIVACLQAEKHVFCETPAVTSPGFSEKAIRLRDERKKVCLIGSCLRFSPVYKKFRELAFEWRKNNPGPRLWHVRYYPYVQHFYNLLLYLNGTTSSVYSLKGSDSAVTLLRFSNGDHGVVVSQKFHNDNLPYEELEVSSISGCLRARDGREIMFWNKPESTARRGYELSYDLAEGRGVQPTFSMPYGTMDQLYLRGYVPELEEFARLILAGGQPTCTIEDMEETRKVWDAVQRSQLKDRWIEVK